MSETQTAKLRVLIVEDDGVSGVWMKIQVEKLGYDEVGWAGDGFEGVTMARELRPDFVLMDMMLPSISGVEATKRILEDRPMPIIAVTATSEPGFIREISECGVSGFVAKPIGRERLAAALALAPNRFKTVLENMQTYPIRNVEILRPLLLTRDGDYSQRLQTRLCDFPCAIETAKSALGALELLKEEIFTAVLVDTAASPRIGEAWIEILSHAYPELPIINLAGFSQTDIGNDQLNQRVFDILLRETDGPDVWRTLVAAQNATIERHEKTETCTDADLLVLGISFRNTAFAECLNRVAHALPCDDSSLDVSWDTSLQVERSALDMLILETPETEQQWNELDCLRKAMPELCLVAAVSELSLPLVQRALRTGVNNYIRLENSEDEILLSLARLITLKTEERKRKREHQQSEEALRKSEAKYRSLVENLNEGIWHIDQEMRTIFVNGKMTEILGRSPEEMLGKHLFDFMDEKGVELAQQLLQRREQGIKEDHEFEFIHKDGSRVYANLVTSPLTDKQGRYTGSIAAVQNVTERKHMQNELAKRQTMLVHAGRLAALGEMATGIAHEINNPLGIIALNVDMMMEDMRAGDLSTEEALILLEVIQGGVQRVGSIIQHIRTFARKQDNVLPVRIAVTKPVVQAVAFCKDSYRKERIALDLLLDEGLPMLNVHATRIEQVVVNLLSNAQAAILKKRTEAIDGTAFCGRVTIRLAAQTHLERGECLLLQVEDDGCGMDSQNVERCFDPFFTTKEVGEGTGLGLSITHGIVNGYNGWMEVKSETGRGSIFQIYFPIYPPGEPS